MKTMVKHWRAFILLIFACHQIAFAQEPNIARIVFYRKASINNPRITLQINNQLIERDFSKRYSLTVDCNAGETIIEVISNDPFSESKKFSLTVESGKTYYLEGVIDYQYFSSSLFLVRRTQEIAEKELAKRQDKYFNISTNIKK